jgi:hypothetical protein
MSEGVGFSVEEEVKDVTLVLKNNILFFLLRSEGEYLFDLCEHDVMGNCEI